MLLRFVEGRPVSPVTCAFLAWVAEHLETIDDLAPMAEQRGEAYTKRGPRYVQDAATGDCHKGREGRGEPVRQGIAPGNVLRDAIGFARAIDGFQDGPDGVVIGRGRGADFHPAAGHFNSSTLRITCPSKP